MALVISHGLDLYHKIIYDWDGKNYSRLPSFPVELPNFHQMLVCATCS